MDLPTSECGYLFDIIPDIEKIFKKRLLNHSKDAHLTSGHQVFELLRFDLRHSYGFPTSESRSDISDRKIEKWFDHIGNSQIVI
jgi:hypothetical protein